jgi:hypothetical protein
VTRLNELPQFGRTLQNLLRPLGEALPTTKRYFEQSMECSCGEGCLECGGTSTDDEIVDPVFPRRLNPSDQRPLDEGLVTGGNGIPMDDNGNRDLCVAIADNAEMASALICGADITDWLVRQVQNSWWRMYHEGASQTSIEREWRPTGPRDVKADKKGMKGENGTCAKGCEFTFTLCGYCVKADVPANIGAVAAVGGRRVREIAWMLEPIYGKDDLWDRDAYDAGDAWREAQRNQNRSGDYNLGAGLGAKANLCKTVEDLGGKCGGDSTASPGMFRRCKPCEEKYAG